MKKVLKIIALLITILIVGLIGLFMYFANELCANKIHSELLSPNKSIKAVIFQRDCGATTGFSTHISILDSKQTLENDSGNIFIIKGHPNNVAPILNWQNNKVLNINYKLNGNEFKSKNSFGLINSTSITYNNQTPQ
ncbi:MAG: hypothetical protein GQ474_02160 [Sulfurimonas sp.]|nr:hypothetical protein [Sulfurimonas sp.]